MNVEDILKQITDIGTLDDDIERRSQLASLSEHITEVCDLSSKLTEQNETLKNENEKLRSANMQLFLQIGEKKTPEQVNPPSTEPTKKLSFDDLFNEKGELK